MPDVTSGWGRLDFGQSNWGQATVIKQGWGAKAFGEDEWGDLSDANILLTGQQATTSVGSITVELRPGWGTLDWGENGWGTVESAVFNLTGLSATSSVGSLTVVDQTMGLTGLSAQTTVGSLTVSGSLSLALPALSLQSSPGLLSVDDHSVGS